MTINDQIRDGKQQYAINREAAKISASSSGKIHKYEYLTGEEILLSNQQQIIEQAKFTYSPLGKAFEKQIKTIEDQGQKQAEAWKGLKPKEQKAIEDKSNNQSRATIIFHGVINKRKSILNELYESFDKNNLKFEYVGPTKDTIFYEYMDSKELLNELKNNCISFSKARKKQEDFFKKLDKVIIGNENNEHKKVINNLDKFCHSREEDLNFL